jgi:hypothetical protein
MKTGVKDSSEKKRGERPKANAKEAQSPKQLSPKSFNFCHSRAGGNPDVVPAKAGIQPSKTNDFFLLRMRRNKADRLARRVKSVDNKNRIQGFEDSSVFLSNNLIMDCHSVFIVSR